MTTDPHHDVMEALRRGTAQAHARLEESLGLLDGVPSRSRFVTFLERLYGFHVSVEPALLDQQGCGSFFLARQRVGLLEADLIALGRSPDDVRALPRCPGAPALARSDGAATGTLYVLEGSTLGG
ncbi:MAG: biliverdin-producing heme oxygenase, partial [Rhodospirillales bacterium]|nr:biliverdin-producing heme oxygenase [Rhodospirillales bacterium]